MPSMTPKYNSLKRRVLRVLVTHGGWIPVPAIARNLNLEYPARALYSYLRRLQGFHLVQVGRNRQGRLFYRATERGVQRLKFLTEKE